jgi:hypothetical protein
MPTILLLIPTVNMLISHKATRTSNTTTCTMDIIRTAELGQDIIIRIFIIHIRTVALQKERRRTWRMMPRK